MQVPSYAEAPPKLIAGAPGVDFLNTVEWRGDPEHTGERLTGYRELVLWCQSAHLLSDAEARALMAEAEQHPQAAMRIVRQAVELRDAAVALLQAPRADAAALDRLNDRISGARFEQRIARVEKGRLQRMTIAADSGLALPLHRIAHEIIGAFTAGTFDRIRSCKNDRCGWFFIDESRNSARRWCNMATCGNQAKARAHFARRRKRAKA